MSTKLYRPHDVETKEIIDYLRWHLQIPKFVQNFSITFNMDDVISINCTYYPENRNGN